MATIPPAPPPDPSLDPNTPVPDGPDVWGTLSACRYLRRRRFSWRRIVQMVWESPAETRNLANWYRLSDHYDRNHSARAKERSAALARLAQQEAGDLAVEADR